MTCYPPPRRRLCPLAATPSSDHDFLIVLDRVETDRPRVVEATWHAHPNATGVAVGGGPGLVGVVGGVDTFSGQPSNAQACVIPLGGGSASAWGTAGVVRGIARNDTQGVAWQGWYSQAYDDAWAAPVLVYRASGVGSGALFGWLIVPQSGRGACGDSGEVVSSTGSQAVVRVSVAGTAHEVTVPLGPGAQ